jgi:2-isopropylmalate synthase
VDSALVYDWNLDEPPPRPPVVILNDETLRDGLQSPSVRAPSIDQKLQILHLLDEIGIDTADIGLPGAGPHVVRDVEMLARAIVESRLRIQPNCAARTLIADIQPIADIVQRTGVAIECCCFIGSSPIRQYAEDWTVDHLQRCTEEAVGFAVRQGLRVMYVTEDTTRSDPDTIRRLFRTAIDAGASRLCIADTVGHATPPGARAVVRFARAIVAETGTDVGIDWHGHNDRGLAMENALWAFEHGADRVHGTILGIGERVGNAPLELILMNLKLMGHLGERNLSKLLLTCQVVSRATRFPIPINYPLVGEDAFKTGTGVHAAAIIKAKQKGDEWLADRVYSGVPAGMFGRHQEIEIGPMSGLSNVTFWLTEHGHEPDKGLCEAILKMAKQGDHLLKREEIEAVIARYKRSAERANELM